METEEGAKGGAIKIQKTAEIHKLKKKDAAILNPDKLTEFYAKKWKSKTLFQVLLMYRAKMFQEFSNFSQQVHLYNQHVIYTLTAYKRYEAVGTDWIEQKVSYEEFIGDPKQIIFRLPFQLNHRSIYTTDLNFDPFAPKWKLMGEYEDWDTPFQTRQFKKERQLVVTRHVIDVNDRAIQVNLTENVNDVENEENIVYHYASVSPQLENKFIGNHLKRNISIYSVRSEEKNNVNDMEEVNIHNEYGNNFTRVFMQLMCPSCCGGLFSETKGSVYMKRPSYRNSKSKSVATTISETPINDNRESCIEKVENEINYKTIISSGKETELNSNPKIEADIGTPENKTKQYRSMSLGATISNSLTQELNQNITTDGELVSWNNKLRKTSLNLIEGEEKNLKQDTIIELKIRGKEHVKVVKQNGNDDPPFNFQAILRKTNNRPSLKRSSIEKEDETEEKQSVSRKTSNASRVSEKTSDNYFNAELFPGVILKGVIYDL